MSLLGLIQIQAVLSFLYFHCLHVQLFVVLECSNFPFIGPYFSSVDDSWNLAGIFYYRKFSVDCIYELFKLSSANLKCKLLGNFYDPKTVLFSLFALTHFYYYGILQYLSLLKKNFFSVQLLNSKIKNNYKEFKR